MSAKIFYKKKLCPSEEGLKVFTEKYISIHETECYHFCVRDRMRGLAICKPVGSNETELQVAKRLKILKKIAKYGSRFAFDTEKAALAHLKFMKRKQIAHMKRDLLFIEKFLSTEQLIKNRGTELVPNSSELVLQHLCFE